MLYYYVKIFRLPQIQNDFFLLWYYETLIHNA